MSSKLQAIDFACESKMSTCVDFHQQKMIDGFISKKAILRSVTLIALEYQIKSKKVYIYNGNLLLKEVKKEIEVTMSIYFSSFKHLNARVNFL